MSCNNKSRVLRVLLGFQQEICSFIAASEQCYMSNALWGSYRSTQSTTSKLLWPTDEKLKNLAQRLYTRLRDGNGRYSGFRKSAKSNLSLAQLRILVRDLLLVASRLRPSCLVDCCALTKDLTKLLLASFADENDYYGKVTQIRAVLLDGNVFFVNVDAFIREKMSTGFQPQIVVDVSANLAQPRRMSNSTEVDALRLEALAVWTFKACKQLVSSKLNVLQWTRPPTLNATALAGLLLCYPCVYDMLENKDNICDNWSKQDNCLTMCPLYLLQGAVVLPQQKHLEIVLYEFSVPQHLVTDQINKKLEHKRDLDGQFSSQVNLLRASCLLQLRRSIDQSFLASDLRPQVRVDTCTLLHVAL